MPISPSKTALATALVACCFAMPALYGQGSAEQAAQVATAAELEIWLAQLDSNRYAEREQATDQLLAAGEAAVPYLERAVTGDSLEAADRAVWVLEQLSDTGEVALQLATLEALAQAERFPSVVRESRSALAALHADLCRNRLVELGAEFISSTDSNQFLFNAVDPTMSIKVNTNRDEWRGEPEDLLMLTKLQHVSKLMISSKLVDDALVAELAAMDGLTSLTLIETSVSVNMKHKLLQSHPDLRVVMHNRAKLGVIFYEGQPLTVTMVQPDTPAQRAGMLVGDRIVKFDGNPVETFDTLTALIAHCKPGKQVQITVDRSGEEITLSAELGGTDWWNDLKNRP